MSVVNLITTAEADTYLKAQKSWLQLTGAEKDAAIFNASAYIQARWKCYDVDADGDYVVDWEDNTTIYGDHKMACARYAYADSIGALFNTIAARDDRGRVIEETAKLGSLTKTTKWAEQGARVTGNPLNSADTLMALTCKRIGVGSGDLTRV